MDTSTPESISARAWVNNALRDGKITRPDHCDKCGAKGAVEAHHPEGASHPHVIRWLCLDCHGSSHAGRDKHLVRGQMRSAARKATSKGEHETETM